MKNCDIIIPIHHPYETIKSCLDSIFKYTNTQNVNIYLLVNHNDADSIFKIKEQYSQEKIITILSNLEYGKIKTINQGLQQSQNDVILLEDHTIVTDRWLEKLQNCAYCDKNIATVTPLSNDGRFSSVPVPFERNELFKNMTIDEMAKKISDFSQHGFQEIPVFDDFCVYIKREVLEEVGIFNEAYQELRTAEIAFALRSLNSGYRHVLCDDTYIYQMVKKDFSDDFEKWDNTELEILEKNAPKYKEQLDFWYESMPTINICNHLILHEEGKKNRPNILCLLHDWVDIKNNLGGTTLHVYDLIMSMRNLYNFHVLAPENGVYKLYSYFENNEMVSIFPQSIAFHPIPFYNRQYKEMLEDIIDSYGISLIHIQHMKGHYFDIVDVVKERQLYAVLSIHDYYSACPVANKMYQNLEKCEETTPDKCTTCLNCVLKQGVDVGKWRKNWEMLFQTVNKIIVPSNSAYQEIHKTFPNIEMSIIEHGINIQQEQAKPLIQKKMYNVAFIGAIGIHKGSAILEHLMNYKKLGNIKIHLFGMIVGPHTKNTKYFTNHGTYKRDELKQKLKENQIDLICLLSTCLETYSYTLTEAVACGIPVLAFNMGALGERIENHHLGYTIPCDYDYEKITQKMHEIFSDIPTYNKIVNAINQYQIKSVDDMGKEYQTIYRNHVQVLPMHLEKIEMHTKHINNNTFVPTYDNYAWVFSTLKWRIISKIKIPEGIKRKIKRKRK